MWMWENRSDRQEGRGEEGKTGSRKKGSCVEGRNCFFHSNNELEFTLVFVLMCVFVFVCLLLLLLLLVGNHKNKYFLVIK